jgi:phosphoserine phosphatase
MNVQKWQFKLPVDAIIFDCDSTLSSVEGITVLAKENGVYQQVHDLTEEAMATTGLNLPLYQQRLDLVRPHRDQIQSAAIAYQKDQTPDVAQVIASLQAMGKAVYIVSAGIKQVVDLFAEQLTIPVSHVYAVEVYFDNSGHYKDFDRSSPLVGQHGKSMIVEQLRQQHSTIVHVGDGMNDVEAAKAVDRFVGYGGAEYRQSVADMSDFYITSKSMAPLMLLVLTDDEMLLLSGETKALYEKGRKLMSENAVLLHGKKE